MSEMIKSIAETMKGKYGYAVIAGMEIPVVVQDIKDVGDSIEFEVIPVNGFGKAQVKSVNFGEATLPDHTGIGRIGVGRIAGDWLWQF